MSSLIFADLYLMFWIVWWLRNISWQSHIFCAGVNEMRAPSSSVSFFFWPEEQTKNSKPDSQYWGRRCTWLRKGAYTTQGRVAKTWSGDKRPQFAGAVHTMWQSTSFLGSLILPPLTRVQSVCAWARSIFSKANFTTRTPLWAKI